MRIHVATALLLCLPAPACSSNEPKVDPEKQLELYMTTATYLYQDESLVRAQDQAVKALQIDPKNRPMRRMIGWIRLRMGTPEDLIIAERFFGDLLKDGDDDSPVLLGLATTQERLGLAHDEAGQAIASGARFTEHKNPQKHAEELSSQARVLWAQSAENYHRVLQLPTQRDKALNGLQRVSALLGNYEDSLDYGRDLLKLCNDDINFWRDGLASRDLNEREEKLFRKGIQHKTELEVDTLLLSTSVLHRLGRTGEALDTLRLAAELSPNRPELYSQRAQLQAEVGRFNDALADIDRFLRLSKQSFEDPVVRRAYELRSFCEEQLLAAATAPQEQPR
jgi:tetratricopeptide (TPR) repeat protein